MQNIDMLLSTVKPILHTESFTKPLIIKSEMLIGSDIYHILEHIKWFMSKKEQPILKINIQSKRFALADVVSVLEIIMLHLAIFMPKQASITFTRDEYLMKSNIFYKNSLLPSFNGRKLGQHYVDSFYPFLIKNTQMRRLICKDDPKKTILSSAVMDETGYFLKNNYGSFLDGETIDNLCEVTAEIIDNCFQHSDGDCLYNLICTPLQSEQLFISLNFVSLTKAYIGKETMDLFKKNELKNYSGFKIVKKAYKYHHKHFCEAYDENSFGLLCSFQQNVSTRKNSKESGGTGLTALVKNINNKSFDNIYVSYVISGNNCLMFRNNFLNVDKKGNIGFNEKNVFYNKMPDKEILRKEENTFPGTIFSINLVVKKGK